MKTSIILPVFNGADFIKDTIESIKVQKGTWELIIVDDCSSDKTNEIVSKYISSNIFYFSNPVNIGVMETMNRAISFCTGDIIRLFSHDDLMLEDDLLSNMNYLYKNPDIGICFSNHLKIDEFGSVWGNSSIDEIERNAILPLKMSGCEAAKYLYLFGCISGTQSNITVRKNVFSEFSFDKNMKYVGDFHFLSTAGIKYGIGYNTDITCKIRFHKNNTSRKGDFSLRKMIEISNVVNHLFSCMSFSDYKKATSSFPKIYGYQFQKIILKNFFKLKFEYIQKFIELFGCKNLILSLMYALKKYFILKIFK
jgi:glycosyltransferase involved in cell wall biosynthesis